MKSKQLPTEVLAHKYLEKVREELRRGRLDLAREALDAASFMEPEHVDVICCRVEVLRADGDYEEAAACLTQALKRYPYRPWWVLDLADLLINRLHEPGMALDWLNRLMVYGSLDSLQLCKAHRLQVEAMIDQDRLYEASLTLHKALSYFPRDINLLFLRGWVSLHRGNSYRAAAAFHSILRRDPFHADAHYYLGLAFAAIGETPLMHCHFEHTYLLDRDDQSPLRFSPERFATLAEEALSDAPAAGLPSFHLMIKPYPPLHLLDAIGLDPRHSGVLLHPSEGVPCIGPHQGKQLVLVVFQRNVERFCCTEDEVQEEIQQLAAREFAEISPKAARELALSS